MALQSNQSNYIEATCDGCTEIETLDVKTLKEATAAIKELGWGVEYHENKKIVWYEHYCPPCRVSKKHRE